MLTHMVKNFFKKYRKEMQRKMSFPHTGLSKSPSQRQSLLAVSCILAGNL